MRGNERQTSPDARPAETLAPELIAPQPLLQPLPLAAAAVLCIALAAGAAFLWSAGGTSGALAPGNDGGARHTVLSVAADRTTGAFKILPSEFQNAPASVLAQLDLPEADKARLKEKLADGSVRLAAVTLWDNHAEDGDVVDLAAAGFSQRLTILHKPKIFFLPLQPGGSVLITGVRDGGGGITLGVSTILGPVPLPPLAVGQSVEITAL
jgi:hypothetical protein